MGIVLKNVNITGGKLNNTSLPAPSCPDTNIEVNGVSEGSVVAGSTVDVQLSDSGGPVTPDSVTLVGTDLQIVLSDAPPPSYASARLVKSGVTTSYADYDAGFYQRGRETSFYKLKENNPYGNIWRFTGIGGGYYDQDTSQYKTANGTVTTFATAFPNSIMIDWTSRDATGVQLWALQTFALPSVNWDTARTNCQSLVVGGLSVWALPETTEYDSLRNWGLSSHYSWLPLNYEIGVWSANTNPSSTTVAFYKSGTQWAGSGKVNLLKYIPTRWTLLTEIGL